VLLNLDVGKSRFDMRPSERMSTANQAVDRGMAVGVAILAEMISDLSHCGGLIRRQAQGSLYAGQGSE